MSKHVLNTRLKCGLGVDHGQGEAKLLCALSRALFARARAAQVRPRMNIRRAPAEEDVGRRSETAARVRELYRDYAPGLVRQLARSSGCQEVARELAHETFLRLLRMPAGRLHELEQPEAFLRRIATNLLRDWARAMGVGDRSTATIEVTSNHVVDQVAALESRDMLRRLEHAVGKLKPRTRQIFLAHRIHGLSYAEIGLRMGISVKGVEKQMSKAIAAISRSLDRD
jgi:RNA polymerase sigma-70 factor (ECF subfamily)